MPRTNKNLARVFVTEVLAKNVQIELGREQANHLINVLRKKSGDNLILFNGIDGAWLAQIVEANRKSATIKLLEHIEKQPETFDLWYGFAPLKKARLDYMVQKATEMGVSSMQAVFTQHTQVKNIKTERINANVIEAAQQCEVLAIPKILPETSLKKLLENWQKEHGSRKLILADESLTVTSPLQTLPKLQGEKIGLLIGPEGGFSEEELWLLHEKPFVVPISLGARILRADTAAVAALALIQVTIGNLR